MSQIVNYVMTGKSIVVIFDNRQVCVDKNHKKFEEIKEALRRGDDEAVEQMIDKATAIRRHHSGLFDVTDDGVISMAGETLPNALSRRVLAFVEQRLDATPLLNFWNRLKKNPNKNSVEQLYSFLERNHAALTENGLIICYKGLTSQFRDIHTQTVDNSPGNIICIDRSRVSDDANCPCHFGLHCGSFKFCESFANGGPVVRVAVDPVDVVSVPNDHDCQKMRVCRYKVLDVIKQESFQEVSENDDLENFELKD